MLAPSGKNLLSLSLFCLSGKTFIDLCPRFSCSLTPTRISYSTETARDVILCLLLLRMGEDRFGLSHFDDPATEKEDGFLRDTTGLLHIMGDNDHRVAPFELPDQFL